MRTFFYNIIVIMSLAGVMFMNESCCKDEIQTTEKSYTLSGVVMDNLLGDASGEVSSFDCYGMLVPSFTPGQLMNEGFEYSDMLDVTIGDNIVLKNVPFVTGFNEVGVLENCFCDYNRMGSVYGFGQLHGNFQERIGGKKGDVIKVTLGKKYGYKGMWEIMSSVYYPQRELYPDLTDEEYANFREVKTSGMAPKVLYRSSNPLNSKDNAVRFKYVDDMARQYGIETEIDLADTKEAYEKNSMRGDFNSTYCPQLVKDGKVVMLGLTADTYGDTFKQKLGEGLKFMIGHKPPYLLHCNEGKDRCGFVSMLLEALAGATYEEIAADYMKTLMNFYGIEKNGASYQLRQRLSIDRLVWLLQNVDTVDDFCNVDWTGKNPKDVNLQEAAEQYVQECGLLESECMQLQDILQGKWN